MPISGYFKGEGSSVMAAMLRNYGAKKGKQVFYATANKTGMSPGETPHMKMKKHLIGLKKSGKLKSRGPKPAKPGARYAID